MKTPAKSSPLDISMVYPTYNEVENIPEIIGKADAFLKKRKLRGEILILDDNSPDGTAKKAESLRKKYPCVRVIIRKTDKGIGAALRDGYEAAKGEIVLSSDSDQSFDVNDFDLILDKLHHGCDLVVGSRRIKGGEYQAKSIPLQFKSFLSGSGNVLIRLIAGVPIHDFSMNFRGFKRNVWKAIQTQEKSNSLLMEMILKAHYKGFKVDEVPIVFKERKFGESKLQLSKEAPQFLLNTVKYSLEGRMGKK